MPNIKATETIINVVPGLLEAQGLMTEDKQFGIAVQQLNEKLEFSATQAHASQALRRIGGGFAATQVEDNSKS